jgi:hypothetical protein
LRFQGERAGWWKHGIPLEKVIMRGLVVGTARLIAAALLSASAAACSDDGDGTGPTPTIDIASSTTALNVVQGSSGTVNVTLTRSGGFAGEVSIAVTGTPTGVTATPTPASIAPQSTSSTITIAVGSTATPGTSTLTLRATGTGVTEKTVPVALTVTAVPAGASTTWEFCAGAAPIWFAAQDGDGAWTRITPTDSKFVFAIASGRGGVALVTSMTSAGSAAASSLARVRPNLLEAASLIRDRAIRTREVSRATMPSVTSAADELVLSIVYGTRAELDEQGRTQCMPEAGKTVNGSVANLGARDLSDVTLGDSYAAASGGTPIFQLLGVDDGPRDLIASRTARNPTTDEPVVDRMIIRRALNQANNSTLAPLDFNAAEAFALVETDVAAGNLGTAEAFLVNYYFTAGAPGAFIGFEGPRPGPFRHRGVPAAKQLPDDLHLAAIFAVGTSEARLAGVYFKEPTDRTITLGDVLPAPTVEAISTTPYARLRAAGSLPAAYDKHVSVTFVQAGRRAIIAASAGYRSSATTYDLGIPDFTGVAGWVNDWGTKQGVQTIWSLAGIGFTSAGTTAPVPAEGATIFSASRTGSMTP